MTKIRKTTFTDYWVDFETNKGKVYRIIYIQKEQRYYIFKDRKKVGEYKSIDDTKLQDIKQEIESGEYE